MAPDEWLLSVNNREGQVWRQHILVHRHSTQGTSAWVYALAHTVANFFATEKVFNRNNWTNSGRSLSVSSHLVPSEHTPGYARPGR